MSNPRMPIDFAPDNPDALLQTAHQILYEIDTGFEYDETSSDHRIRRVERMVSLLILRLAES